MPGMMLILPRCGRTMEPIKILDVRMDRRPQEAVLRHVQESDRPWLYVGKLVPPGKFETCGHREKKKHLYKESVEEKFFRLLKKRKSVCIKPDLFMNMDNEMYRLLREGGYGLIVDDDIEYIRAYSSGRVIGRRVKFGYTVTDEDMQVHWVNEEKKGELIGYKELAEDHVLYRWGAYYYWVFSPNRFGFFSEVWMITYLFEGSLLKGYLDISGVEYEMWGVQEQEGGMVVVPGADRPEFVDFAPLIHVVGNPPKQDIDDWLNGIFTGDSDLTSGWLRKFRNYPVFTRECRKAMYTFGDRYREVTGKEYVWTVADGYQEVLAGKGDRYCLRYRPVEGRTADRFNDSNVVGYFANHVGDFTIRRFLYHKGAVLSTTRYAMLKLLNFLWWNTRLRYGEKIWVYIANPNLRSMFEKWIAVQKTGTSRSHGRFLFGYMFPEQEKEKKRRGRPKKQPGDPVQKNKGWSKLKRLKKKEVKEDKGD